MKPTELRIGNLILDENGDEFSIDSFVDLCPNCAPFIDIDKCKPIPLTEEWLVKFGLHKTSEVVTDSFGRFYLLMCESVELKYVHQLQNLYHALTGEELTIKTK